MDRRGIQRLAAAQVTPELYRELAEHGEDLLVERKVQIPAPESLGAVVSSMANMLGGWILLGVDDNTRKFQALELKPGTDLQSHLGNLLRKAVDPVPPYLASTLIADETEVGFIRVFQASVPVLVKGRGAVYSRDDGGKRPISDHRELLALARAGEEAEEEARERPNQNGLSLRALGLPFPQHPISVDGMHVVVRAAPLTVTPQLAEWPISHGPGVAAEVVAELAEAISGCRDDPAIRPHGRAVVANALQLQPDPIPMHRVTVVADCAGVFGATTIAEVPNVLEPEELREQHIAPPLVAVASLLGRAEAYGDSVLDMHLTYGRPKVSLAEKKTVSGTWHDLPRVQHCGSTVLSTPADEDDLAEVSERWMREIARNAKIPAWESAN